MNTNNDDRNTISIKSWLNEKIDPPHVVALIIAMLPMMGLLWYVRRVFINAWYALVGWVLAPHNILLSATSSILYIAWGAVFCYSIYAFIRKEMSRKSIAIWVVFDMAFPLIGLALYKFGMFAVLSALVYTIPFPIIAIFIAWVILGAIFFAIFSVN